MKRLLYTCIICLPLWLSAQNTGSQISILDKDMIILNWEIAFPTNTDFLDETSFSNGRLEYRHLVNRKFAYGFSLGWYSADQKLDQQLFEEEDGSGAVFTDLVRQVYQLPFSVNGYYYFGSSDSFRPYVGLGLGANYAEQEAFFNVFVVRDSNWGFYARPELGVHYMLNRGFGLAGYVSYNYATNSSDFFDEVDNLAHLGIGIGALWAW